jgi:hypothetical protein
MSSAFAGVRSTVSAMAPVDEPVAAGPVEVEEQEYFHWAGLDSTGRAYPSSEIIHISGGERRILANGEAFLNPLKDAHFHNGMYRTNDPEIIKVLDRMALNDGTCITKSREVYYDHTLTKDQRLQRKVNMANAQTGEIEKLRAELAEEKKEKGRLAEQLAERGRKEK